jgi:preprotein translocase subunit SecG
MKGLLIIIVVIAVYFIIRIFIGSKKSEFYGDSIKKSDLKNDSYEKGMNSINSSKNHFGGPPGGGNSN